MKIFKTALTTWDKASIDLADSLEEMTTLGIEAHSRMLYHTQDPEMIITALKDYDYIIAGSERLDESTLPYLKKLCFVMRNGVGYDNVDLICASRLGIAVAYAPGVNAPWVAEHTLALMLDVARKISCFSTCIKSGNYNCASGLTHSLSGEKTVGLVGFGAIARWVAKYINPFGVETIACDPLVSALEMKRNGAKKVDLCELLERSDFVSMHLPASEDTYHIADKGFFSKMRTNAIFINTARGSVVDEQALCDALESRRIAGAGLDVFESEPLEPESRLKTLDNTVLTPHTASRSIACYKTAIRFSANSIAMFHKGEEIPTLLNPEYKDHKRF